MYVDFGNVADAGRVVTLVPCRSAVHPLHAIRQYWHCLCPAPGVIPPRIAVRPQGLEEQLHAAMILEQSGGSVKFRIAGRDIVDATGREMRGKPLAAMFDLASRPRIAALVHEMLSRPAILELSLTSTATGARAKILLLPLCDYMGEVTMALGGFASEDGITETGAEFTLTGHEMTAIAEVQVTQPGCFAPEGLAALAEGGRVGEHLRLVHSRD